MPYKDPEKAKKYNTDWQRAHRAGIPGNTACDLPASVRIKTAADVLALLEATINEVRRVDADPLVKARLVNQLASTTLRAIESSNHEGRLIDIEAMLKKGGEQS